jgi:hypothetical protein
VGGAGGTTRRKQDRGTPRTAVEIGFAIEVEIDFDLDLEDDLDLDLEDDLDLDLEDDLDLDLDLEDDLGLDVDLAASSNSISSELDVDLGSRRPRGRVAAIGRCE